MPEQCLRASEVSFKHSRAYRSAMLHTSPSECQTVPPVSGIEPARPGTAV
jgi:hypothetical protein